ncbi:FKBP-type peptidyl-prolyl cis-trans isomerase [Maribellus sp. YY47]|uniref:FKBP-type peptidyl-prolyl cis-trans isomerase n=1 Tax=Maribellus sp. YY47 TaxID=2929486 RepID=UPI002000E58F|nr:FKBP-type peptidyl-prolyl cis-trans isomerase [Maribellus sp. YY47]MCK3684774.1 FKBP-type peptidyl-prolyl cis-trans isomerase [Maribellus sp. YY47]
MNIKSITFALITMIIVSLTSCIKTNDEEEEVRTKAIEQAELDKLLANMEKQGLDIDTTALGVYYIVDEAGEGQTPSDGDTVTITYRGYFTNGVLFDASDYSFENGEWEFVYPGENLIDGFNDALSVMNKNMSAEFIIPSELAYGPTGYYSVIRPYETLIFAIEMKDIKFQNTGN